MVGDGGSGDGYEGGDGRARGNGTCRGEETVRDAGQRGGERKRTGGRKVGGKRQEGSGKGKTRKRKKGVQRDFIYGLQNVHRGLVGGVVEHAKGSIRDTERSTGHTVDISKLEGDEEEKQA